MTMIYAVGDISGAHFNPAVTFGFYMAGHMKSREVWIYFAAQLTGGLLASLILVTTFPHHETRAPYPTRDEPPDANQNRA